MEDNRIQWKSTTKNIDEEGVIIEEKEKNNYIKINTIKNVKFNRETNKGTIEYTNIHKRKRFKQGDLF